MYGLHKMSSKKKRQSKQSKIAMGSRFDSLQRSLHLTDVTPASTRLFSVKLQVAETDEHFNVPECHRDLTMRNLKCRLELLVGIPVNFQRLQYLDEMDLHDGSTFRKNDIIPGGTITMRIWQEDAWGRLVSAAAAGNKKRLRALGATKNSSFSTAHAKRLGPKEKNDWLAHRAFVALFVTTRRGHLETMEFLLQNGADVRSKTPLGRTALHVAVTSGQLDCIDILLTYGAKNTDEDNEGHNAVILARLWGQKESERRIFRYQWRMRASSGRSSMKPSPEEKVEAGL